MKTELVNVGDRTNVVLHDAEHTSITIGDMVISVCNLEGYKTITVYGGDAIHRVRVMGAGVDGYHVDVQGKSHIVSKWRDTDAKGNYPDKVLDAPNRLGALFD